jgi:uncharacterized MAPEG superfamily protein
MTPLLWIVVKMGIVTWLSLLVASLIRAKGWTPAGFLLALGNRDSMPDPGAFAGRVTRASVNTLEAFLLFAPLALVAHAVAAANPQVLLGAQIFFWSRLAYLLIYAAGLAYVRTLVWGAGYVGLIMMILALA